MLPPAGDERILGRRFALCVGIGTYTHLTNRNLRYAGADAEAVSARLKDPQRGDFVVELCTTPDHTTKAALEQAIGRLLSAPERQSEDLALLYFSGHGDLDPEENTFCLLPSNATRQADGRLDPSTLIRLADLARWFSRASVHNIVFLLDVCHSGGAAAALQRFELHLETGPNYFILGAARQDQTASQSSQLQQGVFTHCLLRAFEQPPTKEGWLTISQIQTFVSEEITWFVRDHPFSIQGSSVFVDPQLPLVRNPGYPELAPLPPFWNVPFQRNLFFTGQEALLAQLASRLASEHKMALTQPYAISGLGGIGKTQLAVEYAYRHRQDYHAVLWGLANTRENLIASFVAFAALLHLPQQEEPDQRVIVEAVKTWLKERANWLLILDNTDDLALAKEFLPPAFRGHLLFTTRAQAMGGMAERLEVNTMDPAMAALLLLRRARRISPQGALTDASPEEQAEARALAEEALQGLPLALDQAGAYIEEHQWGLGAYRALFATERKALLAARGQLATEYPQSVTVTFTLAFAQVEQANPAAAEVLRLCAFLDPEAIPEDLFQAGARALPRSLGRVVQTPLAWQEALGVLSRNALLRRQPEPQRLSIHRLVQAVLQDGLPKAAQRRWAERAVRLVSRAFPDVEYRTWERCQQLLPHALVCARHIERWQLVTEDAAYLLNQAGYYLTERAAYAEALPLVQRALAIDEQALGPNHLDVATNLNNLANLYRAQGADAEALPLLQRALAIREQALDPDHPLVALSLSNLAGLYHALGTYAEALPLFQQALAILEQAYGPDHPDVALSLNNLAGLYRAQGADAEALPLLQRALAIREKVLGPDHPRVATSLNNLAGLYHAQGADAEALPLLQRALAIRKQALGPNHPDVATSLNNLALLYQDQGANAEALPLLQRALAIDEQAYGPTHPEVATDLNNLAELYRAQGQYSEALPLMQRALAILEQSLGPERPYTQRVRGNYATLLREWQRITKRSGLKRVLARFLRRGIISP